MSLSQDLRQQYHDLWQRVVTHAFVRELGDGTLPLDTFSIYFQQDYVFVRALVTMTAMALAKAPNFPATNQLSQFLS